MNATQAENLRILIRHIERNVEGPLWMWRSHPSVDRSKVGCAICEGRRAGILPTDIPIDEISSTHFGLPMGRLFGGFLEIDGESVGSPTTIQWGAEARKVLSKHGYDMEPIGAALPEVAEAAFQRFMERAQAPVLSATETIGAKLDGEMMAQR